MERFGRLEQLPGMRIRTDLLSLSLGLSLTTYMPSILSSTSA